MDICCYIIFSQKLDKFYTGVCQENLSSRIEKHNTHYYSNKNFTAKTDDWILFIKIDTDDFSHARRIELKIKSMKSSVFIKNLKKYPELLSKFFYETKGN